MCPGTSTYGTSLSSRCGSLQHLPAASGIQMHPGIIDSDHSEPLVQLLVSILFY